MNDSTDGPRSLAGERVKLIPLGAEHLGAVLRWRSDPEVTRYWITREIPTISQIRDWYANNLAVGALVWAIVHEVEPIGYVTLFDIDRINRKAELALMIGERSAWGKGFAKETLRTLLRHALSPANEDGIGLHKVYLAVFDENTAARRAYAACGFHEDGVLRDDMFRDGIWHDQILMSVLAHEFSKTR